MSLPFGQSLESFRFHIAPMSYLRLHNAQRHGFITLRQYALSARRWRKDMPPPIAIFRSFPVIRRYRWPVTTTKWYTAYDFLFAFDTNDGSSRLLFDILTTYCSGVRDVLATSGNTDRWTGLLAWVF